MSHNSKGNQLYTCTRGFPGNKHKSKPLTTSLAKWFTNPSAWAHMPAQTVSTCYSGEQLELMNVFTVIAFSLINVSNALVLIQVNKRK